MGTEVTSITLGSQVCVSNYRGQVRFIGALPARGHFTWVGIDWHIPARGKHDGTVDGVRYFFTETSTSGSFLKLQKVGHGGRRSLLQAVASRHSHSAAAAILPDTIGGVGGRTKFVGVEDAALRQARVEEATSLSLGGMGVAHIDDPAACKIALPIVKHLDLSESLLSSADDVFAVFRGFPALESLNLSSNRFHDASESPAQTLMKADARASPIAEAGKPHCPQMRVLVFNRCNLTWKAIMDICSSCPGLKELRLHRSSLTSLQLASTEGTPIHLQLDHLRVLDLDSNSLNWAALMSAFGSTPSLESVFAGNNEIDRIRLSEIPVGGAGKKSGGVLSKSPFCGVKALSLSGNPIADWQSFSELHFLPTLESLRASSVPLLEAYDQTEKETRSRLVGQNAPSRDALIARIGSLRVLDGSEIHPDERMYAEKKYALYVLDQFDGTTVPEAIEEEHPRLSFLCKIYDFALLGRQSLIATEGSSEGSTLRKTLRRELIGCSVISCGGFDVPYGTKAEITIPVSTLVGKLSGMAARLLGRLSVADISDLKLVESIPGDCDRVVDLDDETRELRYYGLQGGGSVRINVRARHRLLN